MQRDRRQLPHPFFFVVPILILLAVWFAAHVREQVRFAAEHMELPRPLLQSAPKSRFLEEPLPPLKPAGKLPPIARYPAPRYRVRALPVGFIAYDLNDKGIVVGSIPINPDLNNLQEAAVFWERGKVTRLSGGREPLCRARAINANSLIAGEIGAWSPIPSGDSGNDVALWHAGSPDVFTRRSRLIPDIGHPSLSISRLNRWGQFIGNGGGGNSIDRGNLEGSGGKYGIQSESVQSAGTYHLSFFQDGDKTCVLNTGAVYGLNDLGQVVGTEGLEQVIKTTADDGFVSYNYLSLPPRAVLYQGARINTLWEDPATAVAYAINNHQHVVGVQGDYPVLWDSGITVRLQFLPGTTGGVLQDINDRDQIVGHCGKEKSQRAAIWQNGFIWDLNRRLLNSRNVALIDALRINESGQILACDRDQRRYLLTPSH